jgi:hypothetical protein
VRIGRAGHYEVIGKREDVFPVDLRVRYGSDIHFQAGENLRSVSIVIHRLRVSASRTEACRYDQGENRRQSESRHTYGLHRTISLFLLSFGGFG